MMMKTTTKPKILRVWIEHAFDESPDTSCLGEYSESPNSGFAIDRELRGERGRGQYRFLNPDFEKYAERNKAGAICNDAEVRKYCEADYERRESLNAGDWYYLGIIAKAEVQLMHGGPVQVLSSGGLWGIESDSDKDHFPSVEQEQLSDLRQQLEAIGLGNRAIGYAFRNVERK